MPRGSGSLSDWQLTGTRRPVKPSSWATNTTTTLVAQSSHRDRLTVTVLRLVTAPGDRRRFGVTAATGSLCPQWAHGQCQVTVTVLYGGIVRTVTVTSHWQYSDTLQ